MPENIAYGVTITPPDGEPVTGTMIPFNKFKYFGTVIRSSATSVAGIGDFPDGMSESIYKTGGNDCRYTITSSTPYTCLVMLYGQMNGTISGDYNGSYSLPTNGGMVFKCTITNIGLTFSSTSTGPAICISEPISNELSADVIKKGITINGITGTAIGAELEDVVFCAGIWHDKGYTNYAPTSSSLATTTINNGGSLSINTTDNKYNCYGIITSNGVTATVNGDIVAPSEGNTYNYWLHENNSPITNFTINNTSTTGEAFAALF